MKNRNLLQIIMGVVLIFVSITLSFIYVGILIDRLLKTTPIFLIIFAIISIFLSLYIIYIYNIKNS